MFRGDEQVTSGSNGARIVVEAGAYLVRVGSGPVSQMVSIPARAGETCGRNTRILYRSIPARTSPWNKVVGGLTPVEGVRI